MKTRILIAIGVSLLVWQIGSSVAATQSITASIAFETALSFTNKTDIAFGIVQATEPGVYVITPSGEVSATSGGVRLGGDSHPGSMTIKGSDSQTINIAVQNYMADKGVTPSAATCSYDGGAARACALTGQAAPGLGKQLLLGVTLTVDGSQQVQTAAAPSFDVVVTYN